MVNNQVIVEAARPGKTQEGSCTWLDGHFSRDHNHSPLPQADQTRRLPDYPMATKDIPSISYYTNTDISKDSCDIPIASRDIPMATRDTSIDPHGD